MKLTPKLKLLLAFQVIPVAIILFQIGWLIFAVAYPYQFWGDTTSGFLTNWERFGSARVMYEFWIGLEWVVFFFLAGIPFEVYAWRGMRQKL